MAHCSSERRERRIIVPSLVSLPTQLTNFLEVGVEVAILSVISTAVSPILLFSITSHDVSCNLRLFPRSLPMICTRLGRAPHSPRYVQTSTLHLPDLLASLGIVHGQIHAIWSWFARVWGEPHIPQDTCKHLHHICRICWRRWFCLRPNSRYSVLSSRHLRPIPPESFTANKFLGSWCESGYFNSNFHSSIPVLSHKIKMNESQPEKLQPYQPTGDDPTPYPLSTDLNGKTQIGNNCIPVESRCYVGKDV